MSTIVAAYKDQHLFSLLVDKVSNLLSFKERYAHKNKNISRLMNYF